MTQNERVKEVRKTLGLTLEKFGDRLGIKKAAVSKIEKGENSLTDANIKAICREFSVDYMLSLIHI
jgi:transcriptional regulator with XRE-family HTH domain